MAGLYKTQKQSLQATINQLAREHLAQLLGEEEIKYFQRDKVKDVLLGDNKVLSTRGQCQT